MLECDGQGEYPVQSTALFRQTQKALEKHTVIKVNPRYRLCPVAGKLTA
jgi:hypothetical protein